MAFPPQQPFYSPRLPFTGAIHGRLQQGLSIIVSGRVLPGANRFHVNLQSGSGTGVDVALHFNPRYDMGPACVVTNTYRRGTGWGQEERTHQTLPAGAAFNLMILVGPDSYKIATNGCHLMEYKHRIPYNLVDTIHIEGMVEVSSIAFQNSGPQPQPPYNPGFPVPTPGFPAMPGFPAPTPGFPPTYPFPTPGFPPGPVVCPGFPPAPTPCPCPPAVSYSVPYRTTINGGLYPGKTVTVQGTINNCAKGIAVNLCFGASSIALHYNVRFDERVVVRNSHMHNKWGHEERGGGMPFHLGRQFVLTIVCNPHGFNIMVNGNQVHTYKHRHTSLHEINELKVTGDVTLSSVTV